MSAGFFLLCVAATAAIAFAVSGATGVLLALLRRALDRLTPPARARVVLSLVLLPALTTAVLMAAALAPWFGWISDHCTLAIDPHDHPHICGHHVERIPAVSLLVVGAAFVGRFAFGALALARSLVLGAATNRGLARIARPHAGCERVLPLDAPQAFVLGVFRPTLYVTRGLTTVPHREHLDVVLAHECAHLRRADPLRMLVANAALAFHLPGIAGALRRRLLQAQEMAADVEAARAIGDPERVARALVDLSRARRRLPSLALGFTAGSIEARVRELLDERPRSDAPTGSTLLLAVAAALLSVALHAGTVHHAVEHLLGLLS